MQIVKQNDNWCDCEDPTQKINRLKMKFLVVSTYPILAMTESNGNIYDTSEWSRRNCRLDFYPTNSLPQALHYMVKKFVSESFGVDEDQVNLTGQQIYMMFNQDQLIGLATFSKSCNKIYNVCISADFKSKGYGRMLMQAMIPHIHVESCYEQSVLLLDVLTSNTHAKCLYQSLGFQYLRTNYNPQDSKDPEDVMSYTYPTSSNTSLPVQVNVNNIPKFKADDLLKEPYLTMWKLEHQRK